MSQVEFDLKNTFGILDSLVKNLDKTVHEALKNVKPEEAQAFYKAFKENNIPEKLVDINQDISKLRSDFKID